MTCFSFY